MIKLECEFCATDKNLQIRNGNRIICNPCWNDKKQRCAAGKEWRVKRQDRTVDVVIKRCSNSTIDSDGLCYQHKHFEARAWRICDDCGYQLTDTNHCWRCREYGQLLRKR